MTEEQRQAIREDAEQAAKDGKTPNERCPHPFSSAQGKYWVECYWRQDGRFYRDSKGIWHPVKGLV